MKYDWKLSTFSSLEFDWKFAIFIAFRLMYDISPNRGFNIVYELGEFWSENEELQTACSDHLNSTWWKVDGASSSQSNVWTERYLLFLNDHISAEMVEILLCVSCIIGALIWSIWCSKASVRKEKEIGLIGESVDYGSV